MPRWMGRLAMALTRRRRVSFLWDAVLRTTGVVALLALPLAMYLPRSTPLVGFVMVTIWVNGPISPFLPTTYEPILLLFGRLYPPLLVAVLGTAGTVYVELLNYHLYRRLVHSEKLRLARERPSVRWIVDRFSRAPFLTIWLCALTPLPYWVVRFLSPLAEYPVSRHLWATGLGRLPRLWFLAALGVWWHVDIEILFAISLASIVLAVAVYAFRRRSGGKPAVQRAVDGSEAQPRTTDL